MKNLRTFEAWVNDRAEMEMRKSGEELMKKAAGRKSSETGCDCEDCDCENCDGDCDCCSDEHEEREYYKSR